MGPARRRTRRSPPPGTAPRTRTRIPVALRRHCRVPPPRAKRRTAGLPCRGRRPHRHAGHPGSLPTGTPAGTTTRAPAIRLSHHGPAGRRAQPHERPPRPHLASAARGPWPRRQPPCAGRRVCHRPATPGRGFGQRASPLVHCRTSRRPPGGRRPVAPAGRRPPATAVPGGNNRTRDGAWAAGAPPPRDARRQWSPWPGPGGPGTAPGPGHAARHASLHRSDLRLRPLTGSGCGSSAGR